MDHEEVNKPAIERMELSNSSETFRHDSDGQSMWTSIKTYPKLSGYCFALSLTALLAGYDVVIVGSITALPAFQYVDQMNDYSRSLLMHRNVDKTTARSLTTPISYQRGLFLVGKIIQGLALGVLNATTQTFVSETTPAGLRGPALALLPTNTLLGQLIGAAAIYSVSHDHSRRSYLISLATQWPFSVVVILVAVLVPESPGHLVGLGLHRAARESLKRVHTSGINIDAALEEVHQLVFHEQGLSSATTYWDCFKSTNRRRTMILLFSSLIPQLFGLSLLAQASYFMQIVGMAASTSLIFLILGIALGLLGNIVGVWILTRVGRRKLIITSLTVSTILWLGMGIAGCWLGTVTIW